MGCGVKDESFSLERAAVSAGHEMLFNKQNPRARARQKVCADQPADTRAYYDSVIEGLGGGAKSLEFATHGCVTSSPGKADFERPARMTVIRSAATAAC